MCAQKKNGKEKTPLDVAMQVGEDKIVRLLKALLRGEAPPQEAADAGDDDDDDDDDEAYPVNETSTGAKQAAPPQKAEVLVQAAEAVQVAELTSKLKSLSFSTAGKLDISNPIPNPHPNPTPNPTPNPHQASSVSPSRRMSSPRWARPAPRQRTRGCKQAGSSSL